MKHLAILTNQDLANEMEISLSKAEKMGSKLRAKYGSHLTRLHLYDYLGINQLSIISELLAPKQYE